MRHAVLALSLALPSSALALDLSVAPRIAVGEQLVLTATGALPGQTVIFARGGAGGPACPPVLNGTCLALSNPTQMGTVLADDAGTAILSLTVPATAPVGATPRFQAVALRPNNAAFVSPPVDSFLIAEATCSNGLWESPEQCDDANDIARDGCTSSCALDADFRGAHAALLTLEAGAVVPIFGPVTGTCTTEGPLFVTPDPLTSALIVEYSDECIMAGFLGTFGAGGITVQGTVVGNTIVGEATLMVAGLPLNSAPISWQLAAPGVLEVQAPFNTTVQGIAFVGAVDLWSDLSQ